MQVSENQTESVNAQTSNEQEVSNESQSSFLTFESEMPLYSLGFSDARSASLRVAIGSYVESENNKVTLLEVSSSKNELKEISSIKHTYPPTKIKFHPEPVP